MRYLASTLIYLAALLVVLYLAFPRRPAAGNLIPARSAAEPR